MKQIDPDRFQRVFKEMDDAALLGYPELAAIMRKTPDHVSTMKASLLTPAFDKQRFVRWTAGQIRAWLNEKAAQAGKSDEPVKRHGRPRKPSETGSQARTGA